MGEGTDSSDSIKATYEVKYLGRTKVTRKKLTSDAMDTLAERLMAYEESQLMKKLEEQERRQRHSSGASIQVSVTFFFPFFAYMFGNSVYEKYVIFHFKILRWSN